MIYARALDVNIYVKRDFKPLEDRVRDIVTIEDQAGQHHDRGEDESRAGLAEALRRAGDPDRERLGGFPRERSRRGGERM